MEDETNSAAAGDDAAVLAKRRRAGWRADRAVPETKVQPTYEQWSEGFLEALAETSNVTASAKKVGIDRRRAYEAKRNRPEFNRRWREALCEGYELLEMALLQRMRAGQLRGPDGKGPKRSYDNSVALRLLVAHRGEAAQHRAVRDNQDADAILDSINAKLEKMRQARLAAVRQPIEVIGLVAPTDDGPDDRVPGDRAPADKVIDLDR